MNKLDARKINRFFLADPKEIESFDEWAEYLESLLTGPCTILELDGKPAIFEIKALVAKIHGLKIEIFPKEHPPPHFHVTSADAKASFGIRDCKLIKGKIDHMDYSKILFWYTNGAREMLIRKWNESRPSVCVVGEYSE